MVDGIRQQPLAGAQGVIDALALGDLIGEPFVHRLQRRGALRDPNLERGVDLAHLGLCVALSRLVALELAGDHGREHEAHQGHHGRIRRQCGERSILAQGLAAPGQAGLRPAAGTLTLCRESCGRGNACASRLLGLSQPAAK
jgi:hypothetical protein